MRKHTILFLVANPRGVGSRALDREARSVQMELEHTRWRERFEFVTRWAAEPLDLIRELRRLQPTVVQFSGYRDHRSVAACQGLLFQGADGAARAVSTASLRDAFGAVGRSVRLVVLNGCYIESMAEALLAHVDCVVGTTASIREDAARSFAIGFYGGLGERASVETAFKGGCAAIGLEGFAEADRPRLRVRRGVDPAALIPAALTPEGSSPIAADEQRVSIAGDAVATVITIGDNNVVEARVTGHAFDGGSGRMRDGGDPRDS